MASLKPSEHWVFAYGSLMWDPGFPVAEAVGGRIDGYARSFCMTSVVFRGTLEAPGLVLALDEKPGAHCQGLALRVDGAHWQNTHADLRARELATNAYHELVLPILLSDGRLVQAITYVMRRDHEQYIGALSLDEQARIISRAVGGRGPNADYLFNTADHLTRLGMQDPDLDELARHVRDLMRG